MSKKVLSLVLALVMVLGSFSFVSAASLNDVAGTVYEEAVGRLSLLGILEGYPDGSFKPEGEITRAEFAAVAVRAKGLANAAKAAEGLPTGFTDVPTWNWASGVVGTAAKAGIVNGVGHGLFAPQAPVKYEEAITMLVRALGYEASATAKGGYPYGYLIVANEIGLLDEVKGTQGVAATRGIVAQMTDNALEIPLMIQVGFGSETKWVVSGSKEHGTDASEQYLLDSLGFDSVTGRVTSVNSNRKAMTVTVEDEDEVARIGKSKVSIDVPAGFDIYEVEGLETKFWYKGEVVITKVLEEAKYDAIEYIAKDDEIKLITEDEEYEIGVEEKAKPSYAVTINGKDYDDKKAETKADYAKIVINNDDEIIWGQGYTLDGFVVIEEVDGFDVISVDDYNEINVEDYLIVKEGKEISVKDLEEGDVLYYNDDQEFAVVNNNSKTGEIERVYESAREVKFAGSTYDWADDAIYVTEDGKIDELDADILDELMDEEEEVTIFFNFKNEVAVVLTGEIAGTSDYYVLTKNANAYAGRGGKMLALDVRNAEGAKLTFDVDEDFVDASEDGDYLVQDKDGEFKVETLTLVTGNEVASLSKGQVLKITLDKDGEPKEIAKMYKFDVKNNEDIEVEDSKVVANETGKSYRLKSNAVVFYDGTKEAVKLGAAKDVFSEVKGNTAAFYQDKGDVVAIVGETDADTDTTTVSGLFEKAENAKKLKNGQWEIKIRVFGSNKTYVTKDDDLVDPFKDLDGLVIDLEIGEKSGEIELANGKAAVEATHNDGKVTSVGGRNITVEGKNYTLNPGYKVYDTDLKEIDLDDVKGKQVRLYMDGNSARYANYVVATEKAVDSDDDSAEGTVTYINFADKVAIIDGKALEIDSRTMLYNATGDLVGVGVTQLLGTDGTDGLLRKDDVVKDVEVKDGKIVSLVGTKLAQQDAAIRTVITTADGAGALTKAQLDAVAGLKHKGDVAANLTAYDAAIDALTAAEKAAVKTLAQLQAIINKTDVATDKAADEQAGTTLEATIGAMVAATTTNEDVADARAAYDALGAAGKAKVTSIAKLEAAEKALKDAKAALADEIADAKALYVAENASLTAIENDPVLVADIKAVAGYATELADLRTAIDALNSARAAANAFDVEGDTVTATSIDVETGKVTTAITNVNNAKAALKLITDQL
ncbi:S-layer homology domain-containing protein [Tissierella sp. Yu-01]|uniref:S-layer homology domain-containing protein n=1 Tax=Tissierella sp. Yu-01 TaxID=3035694 RepID=UPI00240E6105|nr:S-layer homology domain-containing protein [Tissierella sp. Yu-01]WFA08522.1 S-layer homology domain-containing protein [Tissierella sp. Yu-01]